FSVNRLDGCFDLITSRSLHLEGRGEFTFGFFDHRLAPVFWILLGERHEPAVGTATRRTSRLAIKHQRQQTADFRIFRNLLTQYTPKPDCLLTKFRNALVCSTR